MFVVDFTRDDDALSDIIDEPDMSSESKASESKAPENKAPKNILSGSSNDLFLSK